MSTDGKTLKTFYNERLRILEKLVKTSHSTTGHLMMCTSLS